MAPGCKDRDPPADGARAHTGRRFGPSAGAGLGVTWRLRRCLGQVTPGTNRMHRPLLPEERATFERGLWRAGLGAEFLY
jgi:hypothetical protein